MFKKTKFKGRKVYGTLSPKDNALSSDVYFEIKSAQEKLNSRFTLLVELTVTRIYQEDSRLVEVES